MGSDSPNLTYHVPEMRQVTVRAKGSGGNGMGPKEKVSLFGDYRLPWGPRG